MRAREYTPQNVVRGNLSGKIGMRMYGGGLWPGGHPGYYRVIAKPSYIECAGKP